jgi:branched-chain amino acid transport system permease protein
MSFEILASSFKLERRRRSGLAEATRIGIFAGFAAIAFALIGAYVTMDARAVIEGWLSLGQTFMLLIGLAAGVLGARAASAQGLAAIKFGAIAGLVTGVLLLLMVLAVAHLDIRSILVAASPALLRALAFGFKPGSLASLASLLAICAALGVAGGALQALPGAPRRMIFTAIGVVLGVGLFRDIFASFLQNLPGLGKTTRSIFSSEGVRPTAAVVLLLLTLLAMALWRTRAVADRIAAIAPDKRRLAGYAMLIVVTLLLPVVTNDFVAQVAMLVGLYVLMGMGLNIELGLAGLVDLGFVAFFAVGAYTVALLCSDGPYAIASLTFWEALPIAIVISAVSGLIFGLPILRVRGDYLAMATLGLGEIVRVVVLSDAMRPLLGGSQGIVDVARPTIGNTMINTPAELYYLALALAVVVAYVSWRLQHSKIGRAWLAIREDEDVAQALGIDLVAMKLLAYTVGAAFAGAAGAVFAVLVGSVYPHSFQLLVSINVLAILVIGGLGSLPGVVVGTLALIGLPEMLREFGEYRYLFYGLALLAMMHFRAEGLWPAQGRASNGR